MYRKFFNSLLTLIIFTTCYLIPNTASYADFGLAVYPPILQIEATPPTSAKAQVSIQNTGSEPVILTIKLKPFKSSPDNNGTIELLSENEGIPGNDPLIFQRIELLDDNDKPINQVILGPSQEKKIILHVALPKDEPSGDYYFSILFSSLSDSSNTSNATSNDLNTSKITGTIATNVLLSIGPESRTTGNIKDFSTPAFLFQGPVDLNLLIENTSQHFIVPKGEIDIKNTFGQIVGKLSLLPVNVLEQSSRYMITDSSRTDGTIVWPEKILFGIYSAHVRIKLSDAGPLFDKTIYFFALPVQVLLGIIFACIIITLVGIRVRDRLKGKK